MRNKARSQLEAVNILISMDFRVVMCPTEIKIFTAFIALLFLILIKNKPFTALIPLLFNFLISTSTLIS